MVPVDRRKPEFAKGRGRCLSGSFCGDANQILRSLLDGLTAELLGAHTQWVEFCREVKHALPLVEQVNHTGDGYLSPFVFAQTLSGLGNAQDVVIPCSSGSAFTVMMQTFEQKAGQRIVTNKDLASMGYGFSAAMGAAFAANGRRTILVKGDGGFTQNLQELGTVAAKHLNLKIFLFDDDGYTSIRMTQKNYFGGRCVGCDLATGLSIPKWELLFPAYSVPVIRIGPGFAQQPEFLQAFNAAGPSAILVYIDPTQTYFPKISSRVTESGSMKSNPLHRMTPDRDTATAAQVFRYIPA